jgi:dTDP-4-dehydrorhamnose 3,5-epimerase-like enzyme
MEPTIIPGGCHSDARGNLLYNNSFDASDIKRVYVIENKDTNFVRGWQGHRIEQRWFSAVQGSFTIQLIANDWEKPSRNLIPFKFILSADQMDVLHIPKGYVSSIQALEEGAKLLVMADYGLGEVKDEYRFEVDYFKS